MYYVYMLRCKGDTVYTGMTPDVCRRMRAHRDGTGAKYTRSHPPLALAALWQTAEKTEAARLEYAIKKRLKRPQKERLIACPALLPTLLPELAALRCAHIPNVTWEQCLEGGFDG